MDATTLLFADLSGFTALTEAHGDAAAADLLQRFYVLAEGSLSGGARLVKTIGDAVMVVAPSAVAAARTTATLSHAIDRQPLWPALRAGLHTGPVVTRQGDCFGATVNVAARVAAHARSGQVLCTRTTAQALAGTEFSCRSIGEVQFKNVQEKHEVFEVVDADAPPAHTAVDPVCRMQVDAATTSHRLTFEGRTFFFCSFRCAQTFAAAPAAHIA